MSDGRGDRDIPYVALAETIGRRKPQIGSILRSREHRITQEARILRRKPKSGSEHACIVATPRMCLTQAVIPKLLEVDDDAAEPLVQG